MAKRKIAYEGFHPLSSEELLYRQCESMLKHASSNGKQVPPHLMTDFKSVASKTPNLNSLKMMNNEWMSDAEPFQLSTDDTLVLANCHNTLVQIVAPARPQTLLLFQYESVKNGSWQVFGSVPLIRRLLAAAFICLVAMIALGTSSMISIDGQNVSLFTYKGTKLILNALFLISAAGLGAAFNALFRARPYVTNYTYNPTYEASYWIEFAMGLISGLILSELIYLNIDDSSSLGLIVSRKVTISLLGGFGGLLVYKILNRLVFMLEGIVRKDTADMLDAELRTMEADMLKQVTKERNDLAKAVTKIQAEVVYKDLKPGEINKRLENLVDGVVENNYKPVRELPSEDDIYFDREMDGNYTNLDNPEHENDEYTERI